MINKVRTVSKKGGSKMQFDFLEKIQEISKKTLEEKQESNIEIEGSNINSTEIELAKKLNAIQEFSIDRFEEDMVILENRENGNRINVERNKLPSNLKEGDILKCINGKYSLDKERTQEENNRLRSKMNDLWN